MFCYLLVPDRCVVGGATNNGGNVLRWLGHVAGADLAHSDAELTELAAKVPPGAEGLLMLPYLSRERAHGGPLHLRGAFLGLTQRHIRGRLARAAIRFYQRLQPAFAATAAAVEGLAAWRLEGTPVDPTSVLAQQASKEEMP